MRIKSTSENIFTYNISLKDDSFKENIIIKKSNYLNPFCKFNLGKFEDDKDDKIDEIKMIYKPNTIKNLKYLYHIKKISGGLEFIHMGYSKLNLIQHLIISFNVRLLPWFFKAKNLFKILTIIIGLTTIFIGYKQIELSNRIQKVEIMNLKK